MIGVKQSNCTRNRCVSRVFSREEMSGALPHAHAREIISNRDIRNNKIIIDKVDWEKVKQLWAKSKPRIETKSKDLSERVLELISHARYRKGKIGQTNFLQNKTCFINAIRRCVQKGVPIEIILPAFTFKFTHSLKTKSLRADMAEASSIAKLHELCDQIKMVYPKGATIYIARDGRLYSDIFGRSQKLADQYGRDLERFVKSMGFEHEIKFLDIKTALEQQPDYRRAYQQAAADVRSVIANPGEKAGEIKALKGSAAANLELGSIPDKILNRIYSLPESKLSADELIAKGSIEGRAEKAMEEYLTRNRAIEILDLYARMRPDAVRGSVHIGDGKLPLQLHRKKTQLFPWMGVGIIDRKGASVRYLSEIQDNPNFVPVYVKGHQQPFYYVERELISNVKK